MYSIHDGRIDALPCLGINHVSTVGETPMTVRV